MKGRVSALQAEVLGGGAGAPGPLFGALRSNVRAAADETIAKRWSAALERGAVDAVAAKLGIEHRLPASSPTPYLDLAFQGGSPANSGISLAGARALSWPQMQRLLAAGVPGRFAAQLNAAGDVLAARVEIDRSGGFVFGGPDARLVLVVREGDGVPVDLVAFRLDAPAEWACLFGDCGGGLLGTAALPHWDEPARLRVFDTPLDWMRGAGEGICVIDWTAALPALRDLGERVTLECSPALALQMRSRLERGGLPLVTSAVPEAAKLSLAERIGLGASSSAAVGAQGCVA